MTNKFKTIRKGWSLIARDGGEKRQHLSFIRLSKRQNSVFHVVAHHSRRKYDRYVKRSICLDVFSVGVILIRASFSMSKYIDSFRLYKQCIFPMNVRPSEGESRTQQISVNASDLFQLRVVHHNLYCPVSHSRHNNKTGLFLWWMESRRHRLCVIYGTLSRII